MNFGIIILNQNNKKKQSYVIRILKVLLFILKLKILTKILLIMLKNSLTYLATKKMIKDPFQKVKTRKKISLF